MKKVLVIGGGGREHALVRGLLRSPRQPEIVCAPGNAGIARDRVPCVEADLSDVDSLVEVAREQKPDLVVVGPEAPLVAGVVDALSEEGIAAAGPTAAAAQIEGSKAFAKEAMAEAGVPTASHTVAETRKQAEQALAGTSYPVVLKADVLAAGKGVLICESADEVRAALDALFKERRFGKTRVLIEEHLEGEELSMLALCDGERAVPLAPAQDYKRIHDGDRGPNTGGMGSYSPVPGIDADHAEVLARAIHQPIVDALRARGTPYHGVLYAGLMMTADGPRALEFNCRFGDPETQAIVPRLRSDLLDLLERCVRPGGLEGVEVEWSSEWAVTVVLASRGYPESSSSGDEISGLGAIDSLDVEVLHAGTAEAGGGGRGGGGKLVTAGGRVLSVTGIAPTPGQARDRAYEAADKIEFDGKQMRRDIAARAVERVEV